MFKDTNGNLSSTRVLEFIIVLSVVVISFISIFNGKDLGLNISNMLTFITSSIVLGCEGKKACEFILKNRDKKNGKK